MSKVMGFAITVEGHELTFKHSHHAEQVLRGLVHSGYDVGISEKPVVLPQQALENHLFEQEQQQARDKRYELEKRAQIGHQLKGCADNDNRKVRMHDDECMAVSTATAALVERDF